MAEKVVSPGVFTNEIDQSFLPAAIADIGACIIGPTVKGPALIPTTVTSFQDFEAKFGSTFKSGSKYFSYLTSHTAEQYLRNSNKLTVIRILAGSYSGASATISSSIDPAIVGSSGAAKASASVSFVNGNPSNNITGSGETSATCSFGGVEFCFTSSAGAATATNTTTKIFIVGTNVSSSTAEAFRDTINNSSSLHGMDISASLAGGSAVVTMSFNQFGAFGENGNIIGGSRSGSGWSSIQTITTSSVSMSAENFQGGQDLNTSTFKEVFKLHTLADGEIMNNSASIGTKNILTDGNSSNIRWEISTLNKKKGTFTLLIRRGDDVENRKQVLESYNNITLDPNATNYIGKAIGTQYHTIGTDENSKPFLQLSGDYPRKSKYVRVEVIEKTIDYIDENGNIRVGNASASLPTVDSGSNSGSAGGSFGGGSDGTVQIPRNMYEKITGTNSQGLDPTTGASGLNDYVKALDLISNQDQYDVNLILLPGIIDSLHSSVSSKAVDVCEDRGDCFAIIDPVEHGKNVTDATTRADARSSNYAAMYWPWILLPDSKTSTNRWVPPSVGVAGVYTFNDKVSHEWFAPAGLNRGNISTAVMAERKLTRNDRDSLYDSNVNPIATFPGQGVTVFGQKTLQKKSSALDRINVRRLLIKVKKFIASSSRFLVFEQNTAATRRRFLGIANPFLEQVQSQSGLNAFRVVMDETNNTPDTIDRNQLVGQIFLQPTRTAEFIVLDFTVQPTGASFPE